MNCIAIKNRCSECMILRRHRVVSLVKPGRKVAGWPGKRR